MNKRRLDDTDAVSDFSDQENETEVQHRESSESEGEDLFADGFEKDYKESKYLDFYDSNDLNDEEELSELDDGERRRIDDALNKRDRVEGYKEGLLNFDNNEELVYQRRRRKRREAADDEEEYDPTMLDPDFVLDDLKGKTVEEWILLDQPRKHVAFRFKKFLSEFSSPEGDNVYEAKIQRMCENNSSSLEVSFQDLYKAQPLLALWVAEAPKEMLKIFNQVAWEVVKERFEYYDAISTENEVNVRICQVPTFEEIRDLRHFHVNKLVRVKGVVTKRSSVLPEVKFVSYACMQCQHVMGPFYQQEGVSVSILPKPINCSSCSSKGPFKVVNQQSQYRDFQKITLQESPNKVPPGRLPRHKDVILQGSDLVDSCKPGEEIEVTGIYLNIYDVMLNVNNGFPLFQTVIEANHVKKRDAEFTVVSNEDREKIFALSRDPRISKRIIKSIAPSIYGHEDIKISLALSLFAGVSKNIQNKVRIRGDVNVLMLGDPGTAKSQFLKYVEKTSSRAVYTTGQGASAVGLTACVFRSPITREWTLEGGALVLADEGVCLIDEFDKMNDQDRTSIHEAMEQQSISVSKAGIVCTLQARCAVIAAANPINGRYNVMKSFQENVNLTEPILSRFDILCVVKDEVDLEKDELLARFVVESHLKSHPDYSESLEDSSVLSAKDPDLIDQKLLRLYIEYARHNVKPRLQQMDQDKLAQVYSALRRESLNYGSIPLTVRHVESMIRMAEAHAKMHLRDYVIQDDLDVAISTMLNSFLQANKQNVAKMLRKKFSKYMNFKGEYFELLHYLLQNISNDYYRLALLEKGLGDKKTEEGNDLVVDKVEFDADELELKAKECNIMGDLSSFYNSNHFLKYGFQIEERMDNRGRRRRFITKRIGQIEA